MGGGGGLSAMLLWAGWHLHECIINHCSHAGLHLLSLLTLLTPHIDWCMAVCLCGSRSWFEFSIIITISSTAIHCGIVCPLQEGLVMSEYFLPCFQCAQRKSSAGKCLVQNSWRRAWWETPLFIPTFITVKFSSIQCSVMQSLRLSELLFNVLKQPVQSRNINGGIL